MGSKKLRFYGLEVLIFLSILATVLLSFRVTLLNEKLAVYKELTRIYDVKEYCKKKVRVPNRCNITVSINNIGGK